MRDQGELKAVTMKNEKRNQISDYNRILRKILNSKKNRNKKGGLKP